MGKECEKRKKEGEMDISLQRVAGVHASFPILTGDFTKKYHTAHQSWCGLCHDYGEMKNETTKGRDHGKRRKIESEFRKQEPQAECTAAD